jgi:ubiquinone/menaquinone biosynthesis C-methylase UbiE
MTDHFKQIYAGKADRYEALVSREDYQHNLLPALGRIRPLADLTVVEFGAGTGRLTALLAPLVRHIRAFDEAPAMLAVLAARLTEAGFTNWEARVGDNRALPVADQSADLAIEGWSFGHLCGWQPATWREEIGKALAEMRRVLRPGGTAILLETLGTGRETPQPPTPELAAFYEWLEVEHKFKRTWIRTDYRFASLEEAIDLTRFFFGEELADAVLRENRVILPECTGIWWSFL